MDLKNYITKKEDSRLDDSVTIRCDKETLELIEYLKASNFQHARFLRKEMKEALKKAVNFIRSAKD